MSDIDTDDIYKVVLALIGDVKPVGETHTDDVRYENLAKLTALTDALLDDIDEIATENKDRVECSMRRAGKFCSDFYDYLNIKE